VGAAAGGEGVRVGVTVGEAGVDGAHETSRAASTIAASFRMRFPLSLSFMYALYPTNPQLVCEPGLRML
jgi:hypothetical protein